LGEGKQNNIHLPRVAPDKNTQTHTHTWYPRGGDMSRSEKRQKSRTAKS